MDLSIFEELGLTNAETKIYLALLELGTSSAGPVLYKTKLQNSVVHMTFHKLLEKGYVSFVKKGKVKYYSATDPGNIVNLIEQRKAKYQQLLPELLLRQKKQEKEEAQIYIGFKGFKTMLYDFISDFKPGDEYLFFSFYTKNKDTAKIIYNFYSLEFTPERKKRGIKIKGIAPKELKDILKGNVDIDKIYFVDFPILTNISIFNDKIMFTPWENNEVSFMISSKQLADSFRSYFYSVWKSK